MKKIMYEPKEVKISSSLLENITEYDCFLDIETTGLSRRKNHIYLIGLGFYSPESNQFQVIQYFAENRQDEKSMLETFLQEWSEDYRIFTFNGNTFDLPFLRDRLAFHHLPCSIQQNEKIDLYKKFKPLQKLLGLPSMRQVFLQEFLKIRRVDEEDGGTLIPIYHHYEETQDKEDERLLLLHNQEDVEGMIELLALTSYENLPDWMIDAHILNSSNDSDVVLFQGTLSHSLPEGSKIRYQEDDFYMILQDNRMKGAFTSKDQTIKYYYPDPENYVYLILEEKCIPKILAESIPKARFRKAKKQEAYQEIPIDKISDSLLLTYLKNYMNSLK